SGIDPGDTCRQRYQLEALWQYHRMNHYSADLLGKVLGSKDGQVRGAGVKVLYQWKPYHGRYSETLLDLTEDPSFKVRLETAVALSHEKNEIGIKGLLKILQRPREEHIEYTLREAFMNLKSVWIRMMRKDPTLFIDVFGSAY